MDKLEEKFDNLDATGKVRLLKASLKTPHQNDVLDLFQRSELCIICGGVTKRPFRRLAAIDGEWPNNYFNLWEHMECKDD